MISVVIPAYNAARTIPACLKALNAQTLPDSLYEVLVVDDGSTDETANLAAGLGATVIRKSRGRPAMARNQGIAAANGDIICFTDADCEPLPGWLEAISAPLVNDTTIAASKGVYRTRQRAPIARFVQLEYLEKYGQLMGQAKLDMVDTYSAAFRRDVLLQNGCFDVGFPYAEDRELSYRLASRGYKMVFAPEAAVFHFHAASHWGYLRKKMINGYWVSQIMRRFPQQGVRDSHTPRLQKLQIVLAGAILGTAGLALLAQIAAVGWGWLVPAGLTLIFFATTFPFLRHSWQHDRTMVLFSPYLLLLRSIALGFGYLYGVVAPPANLEQADHADTTLLGSLSKLLLHLVQTVTHWLRR